MQVRPTTNGRPKGEFDEIEGDVRANASLFRADASPNERIKVVRPQSADDFEVLRLKKRVRRVASISS